MQTQTQPQTQAQAHTHDKAQITRAPYKKMPQSTAIILAAGKGTRMKSDLPKVAHTILGRSLVEWGIAAAREAGFERIVVVIGNGEAYMRELLCDAGVELVVQHEQKGTGHAVAVALDATKIVKGDVVVFYGDTPLIRPATLRSIAEKLNQAKTADKLTAAAMLMTSPNDPTGYGRVLLSEDGTVEGIIEEKDCSAQELETLTLCNPGIYAFDANALFNNIKKLGCENAQGEYYLTDMIGLFHKQNLSTIGVPLEDESEVLGINSQSQLAQAARVMQQRINEKWMDEGVCMPDPSLVWIEPCVALSRNTTVLPMTFLAGTTEIHEGACIGPHARLTNTVVGQNSVVDETIAQDVVIDEEVSVGPRAYLRAGTHLMRGSHAGTHIEIKNSTVGEGSKVPHLSYIGDTTIGKNVNIGAGSITCNYNGFEKNPTRIGNNTFIGSNTMMVAPVAIGDDVITGAGSTITKDIEDGSLGIARARQENVPDYTKAYREAHRQSHKK